MKKISILALALIVSLPGCCCKKKDSYPSTRKSSVATYMENGEINDMDSDDMDGFTEQDFTDEDIDLTDKDDMDDLEYEDMASFRSADMDEDELDEDEDSNPEFSWIDAQADDEFQKLYFSFNHYGIRADQKEAVNYDIDQVKQIIAESDSAAQAVVVIEGHTDQEGSPAYNVALSEKRAKTVADLFVAAGVDRSAIKVVGRGQECPAVINGKVVDGSREDREPNRRVEVRVIYT